MKSRFSVALSNSLFAAFACLLSISGALAQVHMTIERVSDTTGILRGTGSLPGAPNSNFSHLEMFALSDPFAVDPGLFSNFDVFVSSTLTIGVQSLIFMRDAGAGHNVFATPGPALYFGSTAIPPLAGDSFNSGALVIGLLGGATFSAIGSSGRVQWGVFGPGADVGTWDMVATAAVPEPETYAMMLAGLGLLGFIARRRKQLAA